MRSETKMDGGWGWVVVLGGVIIRALSQGLMLTFSLFFEEMRVKYSASTTAVSWIYTMHIVISFVCGPIITLVTERFGVRIVTFLGGICISSGFLITAYSNVIGISYIGFGIIGGIGRGLCQVPIYIVISYYFSAKRSLATSLVLSGDSIGGLLLAPLCRMLFVNYGYTGTMLIVSGLLLHCCISALVFRPVKNTAKNKIQVHGETKEVIQTSNSNTDAMSNDGKTVERKSEKDLEITGREIEGSEKREKNSAVFAEDSEIKLIRCNSLEEQPSNTTTKNGVIKDKLHPEDGSTESEQCQRNHTGCCYKCYPYLKLLKNISYCCFLSLMICVSLGISTANMSVAGLALELNFSLSAISYLLSIQSGIAMVTRVTLGFLFDLKPIKPYRRYIFAIICIIEGVSFILSSYLTELWQYFIVWIIINSCIAGIMTLETIIIAQLVSMENFPKALGLCVFFRGFGACSAPIGGIIQDYTGSYRYSMYFAGIPLITAGGIFLLQSWISIMKKSKVVKDKEEETKI